MRRDQWSPRRKGALLPLVLRHHLVLMSALMLGIASSGALGADTPPPPQQTPQAPATAPADPLAEVVVQTSEPKYVAPTRRDRIGRIWAPVMIDGKGPYRLVLDTGANRSAVTARTAQLLGSAPTQDGATRVTGFTGSAIVPTIHVGEMSVGEVYMGASDLPVLADVFGGAQGVLGIEGLAGKRIFADFKHDQLIITRSHGEHAPHDFTTVPLRIVHGLLVADVFVGHIRAKAIIDTGAQGTVGNLMLRNALMRQPPRNAAHEDIIGVTLDVEGGDYLEAPAIAFGDRMTVNGAHVTFGDMYLFQHWNLTEEPALTIGMDVLGTFDVMIIDYARKELQLRLSSFNGLRFDPHIQ
jgi:Aspartyl protease